MKPGDSLVADESSFHGGGKQEGSDVYWCEVRDTCMHGA